MSVFDMMGQAGSIATAVDRINDMFVNSKDAVDELRIANKLLERIVELLEANLREDQNV